MRRPIARDKIAGMPTLRSIVFLAALSICASLARAADSAFWKLAPAPPMGWNSYDAFGDGVTEREALANAQYAHDHLQSHGWQYIVIDFRWYDPHPTGNDARLYKDRLNATLTVEAFGRLL